MHYSCSADTEDFAHFTQESLAGSHAYLYATSGDAQHGLLEETSQVIKIPETYAEAKGSPQRADWKGACGNETDNLREYSVYTQVPLSSVPKGDKILSTKYQYSRRSWTDGSKPAWLSGDMVRKQATTTWPEPCTSMPHREHPRATRHWLRKGM